MGCFVAQLVGVDQSQTEAQGVEPQRDRGDDAGQADQFALRRSRGGTDSTHYQCYQHHGGGHAELAEHTAQIQQRGGAGDRQAQ